MPADSHPLRRARILACGEVLWDLFPEGARFGGAPANFACHAAILGGDVTMLSAVGDDEKGAEALEILRGFGVETSLVQIAGDVPTGSVGVSVDGEGNPRFEIHTGSAWDRVAWTEALEARLEEVDVVYFGTLGQRGQDSRATIRRALSIAREHGILRVLDVNLRRPFYDDALIRDSIAQASMLKLSEDELAEVATACGIRGEMGPEAALRGLLTRFRLDLVVMTRGSQGALLVTPTDVFEQQGIPTNVVDTVGAGDSFTAAFVLGLRRGDTGEMILRKACEIAAVVCSQRGAVPTRIE